MNTLPPAVDYWVKTNNIKTVCIVTDIKDALNKSTGQVVFPKLLEGKGVKIQGTSEFVTGEMDFSAHAIGVGIMTIALEVKDLVKVYGNIKAIDHLTLRIASSEIYGLIGPMAQENHASFHSLYLADSGSGED
jgi:hypothetical protein